jgi:hypothetical protein
MRYCADIRRTRLPEVDAWLNSASVDSAPAAAHAAGQP